MLQLERVEKETRKQLHRYKRHRAGSHWRVVIDAVHQDYAQASPAKAYILEEVFMSGRSRRRRISYEEIAGDLHVSCNTVYCWVREVVLETMLRAARERMV